MSERLSRREALRLLAAAPLSSLVLAPREIGELVEGLALRQRRVGPQLPPADAEPVFFTPHEYRTVAVLADLVLPADERSGSATEAGVPAFIDFVVAEQTPRQVAMRGGLAWLDAEARERFDGDFVALEPGQQTAILDDVAWPDRAPEELTHGVAFFAAFRDMVASGFFSSRMGIEDLGYSGNRYVSRWRGCPDEQLRHIGLAPEAD